VPEHATAEFDAVHQADPLGLMAWLRHQFHRRRIWNRWNGTWWSCCFDCGRDLMRADEPPAGALSVDWDEEVSAIHQALD